MKDEDNACRFKTLSYSLVDGLCNNGIEVFCVSFFKFPKFSSTVFLVLNYKILTSLVMYR